MGLVQELQNLINEHGSASILRERLALLVDKVAELEKKNRTLQESLADLHVENAQLRKQLEEKTVAEEFTEHRGALFKRKNSGGYDNCVFCQSCHAPMFSLEGVTPFHCGKCGTTLNFNGDELPKIISELNG